MEPRNARTAREEARWTRENTHLRGRGPSHRVPDAAPHPSIGGRSREICSGVECQVFRQGSNQPQCRTWRQIFGEARAERARSHFSKTSFRQLLYPAVPGGLSPAEKADKTCTVGDVAEWVLSPCCPACCCWNPDPGPLGTSGTNDRPRRGSVRRGPGGTRPTGRLNAAKSPRTRRRTTIFACAGDLLHSVCSAVATR